MKVYEIGSKRIKASMGFIFILMLLGIGYAIYINRIDMLVIASIGAVYALYYVIPLFILKKPLFIINQEGIRVKNKRVHCAYEDIIDMKLYGERGRQILVIFYIKNNKNVKKTLDDVYDVKLDEIKKIISENIQTYKKSESS